MTGPVIWACLVRAEFGKTASGFFAAEILGPRVRVAARQVAGSGAGPRPSLRCQYGRADSRADSDNVVMVLLSR